jgi:hypothetical protein
VLWSQLRNNLLCLGRLRHLILRNWQSLIPPPLFNYFFINAVQQECIKIWNGLFLSSGQGRVNATCVQLLNYRNCWIAIGIWKDSLITKPFWSNTSAWNKVVFKKSWYFLSTPRCYRILWNRKTPQMNTVPSQFNPPRVLTVYFFRILSNIIFQFTPRSPRWYFPLTLSVQCLSSHVLIIVHEFLHLFSTYSALRHVHSLFPSEFYHGVLSSASS